MASPDTFPYERVLSLAPLVERWRARLRTAPARDLDRLGDAFGRALEHAPELAAPYLDDDARQRHAALIPLLLAPLVPAEGLASLEAAVTAPYRADVLSATPGFEAMGLWGDVDGGEIAGYARHATAEVLRQSYGAQIARIPRVETVRDPATGLSHHLRVLLDTRFLKVEPVAEVPPLDLSEVEGMLDAPRVLDRLGRRLAGHFRLRGFLVVTAEDVTEDEARSALQMELLRPDAMATEADLARLEEHVRTLLRLPGMALGLVRLDRQWRVNGGDVPSLGARPVGRSLILPPAGIDGEEADTLRQTYGQAFSSTNLFLVDDLTAAAPAPPHEAALVEAGYRSLALMPLRAEGRVVGLLELAAPDSGVFTVARRRLISALGPLFGTALRRALDEEENRLQAVIKQRFTAVHPAVEWRFRQAAREVLEGNARIAEATVPIVFKEVFGLYGQVDIRDSSGARLGAIREDLGAQIALADAVFEAALAARPLPALREKRARLNAFRPDPGEARTEPEGDPYVFLHDEIEPLFETVRAWSDDTERAVTAYRRSLDPDLGVLYKRRRAYERSVSLLNDVVVRVLEEAQGEAQKIIPHYFERYKSDGVEFNLYAGPTMVEDGEFDALHLESLRLWQLETMCRVARELKQLTPSLDVPLQATYLVLAQGAPLDVRFRQDEKRFDVDGAYNARYEIVKKRIDKARIVEPPEHTGERVTQPGMLAVIYSNAQEATEYHRYLTFLRNEGCLEGDIEDLDVEDLPGVPGLRAYRIAIAGAEPMTFPGDGVMDEPEVVPARPVS
jgi:hypothetical protein